MPSFHIRKAQLSDAAELSALICETAQTLLKPHYSKEQWDIFTGYYSVQALTGKMPRQAVFCAESDGLIVGTIALDEDLVVGFYTRLQHINQGIGKRLMTHLETYAQSKGLAELRLLASPVGLAFYYSNGWQKIEELTIEYHGVNFEETLMTKRIN